jgi:hypothetical protein
MSNPKMQALAQHLSVELDEIAEGEAGPSVFELGSKEYTVLTDEEADAAARAYIEESVWAFRASFIRAHAELPEEAEEMIQAFQEKKCEGANETIKALIKNWGEFVQDAISSDGRGHFVASYDHTEHEEEVGGTRYYIYRTN